MTVNEQRATKVQTRKNRFSIVAPASFSWRSQDGVMHRAEGTTRDISAYGVFIYAPDARSGSSGRRGHSCWIVRSEGEDYEAEGNWNRSTHRYYRRAILGLCSSGQFCPSQHAGIVRSVIGTVARLMKISIPHLLMVIFLLGTPPSSPVALPILVHSACVRLSGRHGS